MYSRLLGRIDDHDIVSSLRCVRTSDRGSSLVFTVFTVDQIRSLSTTIVVCSDETPLQDMRGWRRLDQWMGAVQKEDLSLWADQLLPGAE